MSEIPSMQTLRAVEAAARHQSFTRAAAELGLTHGAISHRVRALEARLGARLFQRVGRRMVPTRDGQQLLANLRAGLQLLEAAFGKEVRRAPHPAGRLVLSLLPAFAQRWLVPRLDELEQSLPGLELEIRTSAALTDFEGEGIDAAVRFGLGGWPGLEARFLARETLGPLCSPAYRDRLALAGLPLENPGDLARCRILRHPWEPWGQWSQPAGIELAEPTGGLTFHDAALLLDAAAGGLGVALGRSLLAAGDLQAGRLVRPFGPVVEATYGYHLVFPQQSRRRNLIEALGDWLRRSMEQSLREASTDRFQLDP